MDVVTSPKEIQEFFSELHSHQEKVLVVGLGISGIEACTFLQERGIGCIGIEREHDEVFYKKTFHLPRIKELLQKGVPLFFGVDGEGVAHHLEKVRLAIVSPGISYESAICTALKRRGIPLLGEFEVGIALAQSPSIIVTGSNGKSTTVCAIHHLLSAQGTKNRLCGNVGIPVIAESSRVDTSSWLIVEASSYQLDAASTLKPKVGVFLNLSDNHLERHGSMERYFEAKAKLFKLQDKQDFAIINREDQWGRMLLSRLKSKVLSVGTTSLGEKAEGAVISYAPKEGVDEVLLSFEGKKTVIPLQGIPLKGIHNRFNIAAAFLACLCAGADATLFASSIREFSSLPHRLEELPGKNAYTWINDSKSTTIAASLAAFRTVLEEYPNRPVRLLLGGVVKAGSWKPLMEALRQEAPRCKPVVLFGQDRGLLKDQCRFYEIPYEIGGTLEETVALIERTAEPGEVILFSPGAASFDEFRNFEERGEVFRRLVGRESTTL